MEATHSNPLAVAARIGCGLATILACWIIFAIEDLARKHAAK